MKQFEPSKELCVMCGKVFIMTGAHQNYCIKCRNNIRSANMRKVAKMQHERFLDGEDFTKRKDITYKKIIDFLENGKSIDEISKIFRCSRSTVVRRLKAKEALDLRFKKDNEE